MIYDILFLAFIIAFFFIFLLVLVRLHTEIQLPRMPGSVSKVCVGGGWWWLRVNLAIDFGLALV